MDRFVKRSRPDSGESRSQSPQPPSKKPTVAAKQGNVSAAVRVAKFGSNRPYRPVCVAWVSKLDLVSHPLLVQSLRAKSPRIIGCKSDRTRSISGVVEWAPVTYLILRLVAFLEHVAVVNEAGFPMLGSWTSRRLKPSGFGTLTGSVSTTGSSSINSCRHSLNVSALKENVVKMLRRSSGMEKEVSGWKRMCWSIVRESKTKKQQIWSFCQLRFYIVAA